MYGSGTSWARGLFPVELVVGAKALGYLAHSWAWADTIRIEMMSRRAFDRTGWGMAACGALIAAPVHAQSADSIIVTGSRTGNAVESYGGTVIEAEEISLVQPNGVLDMIDRVPGVRAFSKGGAGGPSYLSLRGGEPNFTLVLLDGVKVNDPTNSRGGAFDFGLIDPLALERIEVFKGALSAVHGADALSGVVNLRLRAFDPGERLATARLTGDSEGGLGVSGTAGTGWGGGSLLAGAGWSDSGDLTEDSDLGRWQVYGRASQTLGELDISALALHARADRRTFPEDSGGPRLAVIREREERETRLTLAGLEIARSANSAWRPRLALHWSQQRDDSDTPAIGPGAVIDGVPALTADSRFRRAEAVFDNRLRLSEAAEIAFGAAWLREEGASEGTIDFGVLIPADFRIERSVWSGFAEATVRPADGVVATLGLRHDDPSTADAEWTGRASLRWQPIADGPALIGSWSEGYKLPNPDLRPERSENIELGAEQDWANGEGRARLVWFRSRYSDLIDFDPERFINVNRSRVTAEGLEAELRAPVSPAVAVSANLTYTDTDPPTDAPPLRSRPEWQGLLAVDWRPSDRLQLQLAGEYTGDFFDSSVPTGLVTLDGRFLASVSARYRLSDAISLTLSGHNLLAADYEEAVGFPEPGRVVRFGVAFHPPL